MFTREEIETNGLDVFANFLKLVWMHLGLPEPDQVQLEFADFLQYGPKRIVILAFRGAGKTWITGAYVLWRQFLNPQLNIKIVSAAQDYANDISVFIFKLMNEMPLLQWLRPRPGQRTSAIAFDVGPAGAAPTPSVSSVGFGGQITGSRADLIIVDDVETKKNTFTDLLRLKLVEGTKEFEAVLKPDPLECLEEARSRVIYLGTPHTEATIYRALIKRSYVCRIWPSRVPAFPDKYLGMLGPIVKKMIAEGRTQHPSGMGMPIEPLRHGHEELLSRLAAEGFSEHEMQYQLDPTPADRNRFPLKTGDFLVYDMDEVSTPIRLVHSQLSDYIIPNFPSGGIDGDVWRRPMFESEERSDYQGTVMCIDPSGKGQDETGYAIVRYCQGMLYWVASGGFHDGLSDETQRALAALAVVNRCNHVAMEPNYGGGAFGQLLKPYLKETADALNNALTEKDDVPYITPALVEDMKWASGQKEIRILDVLEPSIQGHRIIISRELIDADMKQQDKDFRYSVVYQLTHLTRDKGSLGHEDRVEALAMCVDYYKGRLARDMKQMVQRSKSEAQMREFKKVIAITKMGGVLLTDNRIGHEQTQKPKRTIHTPCGNTPFDWRPGSGHW